MALSSTDMATATQRTFRQEAYIVGWAKDGSEAWDHLQDSSIQFSMV